jgi:hypothetical protein
MLRNLAMEALGKWLLIIGRLVVDMMAGLLRVVGAVLEGVFGALEGLFEAGCGCLVFIIVLVIIVALVKLIWTSLP